MNVHATELARPTARPGGKAEINLLSAVVCPLVRRELPQALANFRLWNDEVPPGPPTFPGQRQPRLIFSFNGGFDAEIEAQLVAAFEAAPNVKQAFEALEVRFLDLPAEKDRYIKNPTGPAPKYGYKSGPNWMFYETTKALRGEANFIFLMEVDCVPLVPNWLRRLSRACSRHDDAWVLGAHYSGASPLLWRVARHINGNALYHVGDPDFATFLDEILWPWMLDHIDQHDPDLAYDCAWETFLNREEMDYLGHHDWIVSRGVLHKFRLIDTVVNVGGYAEQSGQYIWTRHQLLQRFPSAAIVHGPVSPDAAHRRGRFNVGRISVRDGDVENGRIVLNGPEGTFLRSFWPAHGAIEAGEEVSVTLTVRAHPDQIVAVDLREPSGGIVERRRAFAHEEGFRRVKIDFVVPRRFNYLNLVLMVLRQTPDPLPIVVEEVLLAVGKGDTIWRLRDVAVD